MRSIAAWQGVGRVVCGGVLLATCLAQPAHGSDDVAPAAASQSKPTPHVTQSLRVKSPSVTVRANPTASKGTAPGAGQYAFIDEDGLLTSTPPADFVLPEPDTARGPDPMPRRSTVDPNAMLYDTSHIHAVMRAKVDATGKATIECFHSTDPAVQKSCSKSHTPEPAKAAAGAGAQEDGQ